MHTPRIPKIDPVGDACDRPLWSVMIPAYRCLPYVAKAVGGVQDQFAADDNVQIAVITDGEDAGLYAEPLHLSDNRPWVSVLDHGAGRLGAMGMFNECVRRARGHLVHVLHGDDVVYPGFYAAVAKLAADNPEAALLSTLARDIDPDGNPLGDLTWPQLDNFCLPYANPFRASSVVVRRSFYEQHGGFDEALPHCGDWEMWSRALELAGGAVAPEVLCGYRNHAEMDTVRMARTADNLKDWLRVCEVFSERYGADFDRLHFLEQVKRAAGIFGNIFRAGGERAAAEACERFGEGVG